MGRNSASASLTEDDYPFDKAHIVVLLFVFGGLSVLFGSVMTGVAYAHENKDNYTSVAEHYGLKTDAAGPTLLSVGGALVAIAYVFINYGAMLPPQGRPSPAELRRAESYASTRHAPERARY